MINTSSTHYTLPYFSISSIFRFYGYIVRGSISPIFEDVLFLEAFFEGHGAAFMVLLPVTQFYTARTSPLNQQYDDSVQIRYKYHREASVGSASTLREVSSGVLETRMTDHVVTFRIRRWDITILRCYTARPRLDL